MAKAIVKKAPGKKAPGKVVPVKKGAAPKKAVVKKVPGAAPADRSLAVATTWADPAVAASRALRHRVKVGNVEYKSVGAAFAELGLPIKDVIRFRRSLVLSGGSVTHADGKKFSLVV